jgi:hypothetical protein
MRIRTLLLGGAVALLNVGCCSCDMFVVSTVRNMIETPMNWADEGTMCYRNYRLACRAWHEVQGANPETAYSSHYAAGFKAGYADYLDSGGNGDPPAVPPYSYRSSVFQTPQGYQSIEEWYAGFRHGSSVARESGRRKVIVLPLSSPPINAVPPPFPVAGVQPKQPGQTQPPGSLPPAEELPLPKKDGPGGDKPDPGKPPEPRPPEKLPEDTPPPFPAGPVLRL